MEVEHFHVFEKGRKAVEVVAEKRRNGGDGGKPRALLFGQRRPPVLLAARAAANKAALPVEIPGLRLVQDVVDVPGFPAA